MSHTLDPASPVVLTARRQKSNDVIRLGPQALDDPASALPLLRRQYASLRSGTLMNVQRTLRRSISCAGIGLHSGKKVTLSLRPAAAGTGIRFRRADLGGLEVPATVQHVGGINYATGLSRDAVHIDTVEHLLSAIVSLGIDNVLVELNSPEVPIMDGSAAPFVYLIHEAGVKVQPVSRKYMKVLSPITMT